MQNNYQQQTMIITGKNKNPDPVKHIRTIFSRASKEQHKMWQRHSLAFMNVIPYEKGYHKDTAFIK